MHSGIPFCFQFDRIQIKTPTHLSRERDAAVEGDWEGRVRLEGEDEAEAVLVVVAVFKPLRVIVQEAPIASPQLA